jgi:hypothetical protein
MDELPSYKDLPHCFKYTFLCRVAVWRARLDAKAWGKQRTILLYFTEEETGARYCLAVFNTSYYMPEDRGFDFRRQGRPGDFFELETGETRTGRSKLISAKVLPQEEQPESAEAEPRDILTPVS